jgi:hypothetical protein
MILDHRVMRLIAAAATAAAVVAFQAVKSLPDKKIYTY